MPHLSQFTMPQKQNIMKANQMGSGLIIAPNKTQVGGLIGSLLASVGIPHFLGALSGKGLKGETPSIPQPPPPYYGNWPGRGTTEVNRGRRKKRTQKAGGCY